MRTKTSIPLELICCYRTDHGRTNYRPVYSLHCLPAASSSICKQTFKEALACEDLLFILSSAGATVQTIEQGKIWEKQAERNRICVRSGFASKLVASKTGYSKMIHSDPMCIQSEVMSKIC